MNEPERWLRDPGAPKELSSMLEVAKAVGPTPAQKSALAAQLGASSAVFWTLPTVMKSILVSCLGLGVGVATYQMSSTLPVPTHSRASSGSVPRAAEPPVASPLPPAASSANAPPRSAMSLPGPRANVGTQAESEPQPRDDSARQVPSAYTPSSGTLTPRQVTGRTAPRVERPSEARLLAGARAALAKDPAKALEFVRQHQSLYPHGVLAQEREVLKVSALREAGQDAAAQKAAASFRKNHPDSLHHLDR